MSDVIKLSGVGVDCPDAGGLAAFYAEITGGTETSQNERWASMSGPGDVRRATGERGNGPAVL